MFKLLSKVPNRRFILETADWLAAHGEKNAAQKLAIEVLKADPKDKSARFIYAKSVTEQAPADKAEAKQEQSLGSLPGPNF